MIGIYVTSLLILFFGFLNLFGLSQDLFFHQFQFFLIGLLIFFIIKKIGRNFFLVNYKFFYWLLIGTLVAVLFFGEEVRGARRWLNFSIVNFQPSEFLKIFFVIYFSQLIVNKKSYIDSRIKFILLLVYFFIPAFFIFKQPDLGTTIVFGAIFTSLILFSDIPKKYFLNLIIFLVLALPLGWFLLQPYQKVRLFSFFNPHLDQQGTAYNMIQSIITIGSGKYFGKGLGLGTQAKLYFLPENYTDFSFASLVEQFGFFGGAVVIALFFLLCFFILRQLFKYLSWKNNEEKSNFYYIIGFLSYLVCQIVINIGMNMGIVPVTGITLPLISYGGSSLVSLMVALALMP